MDDLDMDSLELPEIKELDTVTAEKTDISDSGAGENEYEVTDDYEFDPNAMPVFEELGGQTATPVGTKPAGQQGRAGAAMPAFEDMGGAIPAPKPPEKKMSAMERRMQEPFDMPGAYVPPSKQAAAASPNPMQGTSGTVSSYQSPSDFQAHRRAAMDQMYADRQAHYDKGKDKAKIVGIIVIAINVLAALSSLTNEYYNVTDKVLNAASSAVFIFCTVMFLRGSYKYRNMLGKVALFEAAYSIIDLVKIGPAVEAANNMLMSMAEMYGYTEAEAAAMMINPAPLFIRGVLTVIGYLVAVYFFIFDSEIADYAMD